MAGAGCMVMVPGIKKETDENSNESNEVCSENVRKNGEYSRYAIREKPKRSVVKKVLKNGQISRLNGTTKSTELAIRVRSRRGRTLNSEDSPSKKRRSPRLEKQEVKEKHLPSVPLMFECSCPTATKMGRTPLMNETVPSSPVRRALNCQCMKLSTMKSSDLKDRFLQHSKAISLIPNHSREDCEETNSKYIKTECKTVKNENGKIGLFESCPKNGFKVSEGIPNGLIHTKNGVYFQHSFKDRIKARKFPTQNINSYTHKQQTLSVSKQEEESNKKSQELTQCKWTKCQQEIVLENLADHIKDKHVEPQKNREKVSCLWTGCKVYEKHSSSFAWLERHMLNHSGAKPFKCIVDGCGLRFSSRGLLERHVNSHFNKFVQSSPKVARKEETPTKSRRKKSKRRRQGIIKVTDYVDSQIMEGIKNQLAQINQHTKMDRKGSRENTTFQYTVIAKRTDQSGKSKVLVHWTPTDVLDDMWVMEDQLPSLQRRMTSIKTLPQYKVPHMEPTGYHQHRFRKHKRK